MADSKKSAHADEDEDLDHEMNFIGPFGAASSGTAPETLGGWQGALGGWSGSLVGGAGPLGGWAGPLGGWAGPFGGWSGPNGAGPGPVGGYSWPLGGWQGSLGGWQGSLGGWQGSLGGWQGALGGWAGALGQKPRLTVGLGWHPDVPDCRDLQAGDAVGRQRLLDVLTEAAKQRQAAGLRAPDGKGFRSFLLGNRDGRDDDVDLREELPDHLRPWPVYNQGPMQSCTAQAVAGLVEYLVRRAMPDDPRFEPVSRLFIYHASRRLLGWTGDTGSYLRTTIKALALFGVPPERYWPYHPSLLDQQPDAFPFSYAANYKALHYLRLDGYGPPNADDDAGGGAAAKPAAKPKGGGGGKAKKAAAAIKSGETGAVTLELLKRSLADGFPVAFGFPVYSSLTRAADIPIPTDFDKLLGGHAVLAVGYDDDHVNYLSAGRKPEKLGADRAGAVLVRNSWGDRWGDEGYGWLPYHYVEQSLAVDFWTVFKQDWIDPNQFA